MLQKKSKLVLISSYRPRDCGIATFSHDLITSIQTNNPHFEFEIIPVNEPANDGRKYHDQINTVISQENKESYLQAAEYINKSDALAVSIQHEYGLYGGDCGEYIIELIDKITKPVVTTLHTVLAKPSPKQKEILQSIAEKSSVLVVMAGAAVDLLTTIYNISPEKITIIPHGVPGTIFTRQKKSKEKLALSDQLVLSTFGLIGPGKGLEYVIDALPIVKKKFPQVKYLILGRTHPNAIVVAGESYRQQLVDKISKLGLTSQIGFLNRFLSKEELIDYLQASDLYITPYLNPEQITSGTLAYALSMGRACISTPYVYAQELLADDRGVLVPFRDSASLAEAIVSLLSDEEKRKKIERKNYAFSRPMTWKNVSRKYINLFKNLSEKKPRYSISNLRLPPDLSHLKKLTTRLGVFQHSKRSNPDPSFGYSIDDNARALIAVYQYYETYKDKSVLPLAKIYFENIKRSKIAGSYFHNFSDSKGVFTDDLGSETSSCRAIWALGYVVSRSHISPIIAKEARELLGSLPPLSGLQSPRSKAYALIGYYYLEDKEKVKYLADSLVESYENIIEIDWFERYLAYANAIMPLGLLLAYILTKDLRYKTIGEKSFHFLDSLTRKGVFPSPITHLGCQISGKGRPVFDQQVIEAADMVLAASAGKITSKDKFFEEASKDWLDWFYGKNQNQIALIDEKNGSCFDGLTPRGVNLNQGAESVICYLLAYLVKVNANSLNHSGEPVVTI